MRIVRVILFLIVPLALVVVKPLFPSRLLFLQLDTISISGTGSMYPTFPKGVSNSPEQLAQEIVGTPGMFPYPSGIVLNGKRYFGYQIGRGDIVVFENEKTDELSTKLYGRPSGWVKRVIGVTGDTIEIRSGIVYLNDQALREPYTALPRSTFGEQFLSECKKITVPENTLFVMGDNRKGSGDSREIGFISLESINHVLPLKNQIGTLDTNYRNTDSDFSDSSKIKLDKKKYLDLLNLKRKEAKISTLKYQPKLEASAIKRGKIMFKFNDLSFEATRSGYTMQDAMSESGYSNIVYGEAPTLGYYDADELIENQFEFPQAKDFLLNKDYQEVGISEVEGELNGCPAQIIVLHIAGYVPPNYKQTDIESWENALKNIESIIPGWEEVIGWGNVDQVSLNALLSKLYRQRDITKTILIKMHANRWFSKSEKDSISEFELLSKESHSLAEKINQQN